MLCELSKGGGGDTKVKKMERGEREERSLKSLKLCEVGTFSLRPVQPQPRCWYVLIMC